MTPTQQQAALDIYNFEQIVPDAAATVFSSAGLDAWTWSMKQQFQKDRARCEITFRRSGEYSPKRIAVLPDNSQRTSCFKGTLTIEAISGADVAGKLIHSEYRAQVRNCVELLQHPTLGINGSALTRHKINFIVANEEPDSVKSEDGYEKTTFSLTVDISVQQDAWAALLA